MRVTILLLLLLLVGCQPQPDKVVWPVEESPPPVAPPPVMQQFPVIDYGRLNLILDNQRQQAMSELRRILQTMREEGVEPAPALVPVPEPQPTPAEKPAPVPISLKPLAAAGTWAISWLMRQDWSPAPECLACPGGVCSVLGVSKGFQLPKQPAVLPDIAEATEKPKVIMGRIYTLVAFTGPGCRYCEEMKPAWEAIRKEGFTVTAVDTANPPAWAAGYRPSRIPVTAMYLDDKAFVKQWVGVVGKDELLDALRNGVALPLGPVLESPENQALMEAARESAKLQADRNKQGHYDWQNRSQRIIQLSGFPLVREICSESWEWQKDATEEELWAEAFRCWRLSDGKEGKANHWSVAGVKHDAYGKGLAQGSNKIWYAAIVTGDYKRQTIDPGQPIGTDGETAIRESGADSRSVKRSGEQEDRASRAANTTRPAQNVSNGGCESGNCPIGNCGTKQRRR